MGWNDHMDPEVADRILCEQIPGYEAAKRYVPSSMIPQWPEPVCDVCDEYLEDEDSECEWCAGADVPQEPEGGPNDRNQ